MSTEEVKVAAEIEKETAQQKAEPISPSKRESTVDVEEEEVDEEEDFLQNIEEEELKKEQSFEHHQSSNSNDAPTLLKNALKSGDVKADDSEEEEKKESSDKDNNDKDEQNEPHVHQRVSFFTRCKISIKNTIAYIPNNTPFSFPISYRNYFSKGKST